MRHRALSIALLVLLLATAGIVIPVRREAARGPRGLLAEPAASATALGVEVRVEGGFVRVVDGADVVLRATTPTPRIHLASHADSPVRLRLHPENAWRRDDRLGVRTLRDGVATPSQARGAISVTLEPQEQVTLELVGPPTLAEEFEFVFVEGGGESLADLHALLRGLGEDMPAFVLYRDHGQPARREAALHAFAEMLEAHPVPVFAVDAAPGHAEGQAAFRRLLGPSRVSFGHAGSRFILLAAQPTGLSEDDWAWLLAEIRAARGAERVFVVPPASAASERDPAVQRLVALQGEQPNLVICTAEAWIPPAPFRGNDVLAYRVRVRLGAGHETVASWPTRRAGWLWRSAYEAATTWMLAAQRAPWLAWAGAVLLGGWALLAAALLGRLVGLLRHAGAGLLPPPLGRLLAAAAALAAMGWLYLADLDQPHLTASNETKRVASTMEMRASGDLVLPTLLGQPYLFKPPLYNWLNLPFWPRGAAMSEARARIPSFLAGVACLLVVGVAAARWFGPWEALASVAVLATSTLFLMQAREGELDMLLVTLTTLSLCLCLTALTATRGRLGWWLAAFAALAGATMTKGPVPLVIAALTLGTFLAWTSFRRWRCGLGLLLGAALLVALVAPWCVLVVRRVGWDFAWHTFMSQSVRRVAEASRINVGPWYFYLVRLPMTFFPWVFWLPAVAAATARLHRPWREDRLAQAVLWLGLWLVPSFIFFSICAGKEAQYVLPLYPPMAMLCGLVAVRGLDGQLEGRARALLHGGSVLAGVMLVLGGIGLVGGVAAGRAGTTWFGAFPLVVLTGGAVAAAGALWLAFWRRRSLAGTVAAFVLAAGALKLFYVTEMAPQANAQQSTRAFSRRVRDLVPRGAPLLMYEMESPGYAAYAERIVRAVRERDRTGVLDPAIASSEPAYFLIEEGAYQQLVAVRGEFGRVLLAGHAGSPVLLIANRAAPRSP